MALVNPYCTVAEVRDQQGDSSSKLSQTLIEKAINATSRAVDRYCGRRFWQDPVPVARVYDVHDPCEPVEVDDISTTAGLIVRVDPRGDGSYATTWTSADYQLRPLNADADGGAYCWRQIAPLGGRSFPIATQGRPALQVTARWGWSQLPDDVAEAAVIKAVSLFKRKDAPQGVAGFGEFGVVRIGRYDPDVTALLDPFVLPGIA